MYKIIIPFYILSTAASGLETPACVLHLEGDEPIAEACEEYGAVVVKAATFVEGVEAATSGGIATWVAPGLAQYSGVSGRLQALGSLITVAKWTRIAGIFPTNYISSNPSISRSIPPSIRLMPLTDIASSDYNIYVVLANTSNDILQISKLASWNSKIWIVIPIGTYNLFSNVSKQEIEDVTGVIVIREDEGGLKQATLNTLENTPVPDRFKINSNAELTMYSQNHILPNNVNIGYELVNVKTTYHGNSSVAVSFPLKQVIDDPAAVQWGNSEKDSTGWPSDVPSLSGKILKILVKEAVPFVKISENNTVTGYSIDYMDLIGAKLGFTAQYVICPCDEGVTGMINMFLADPDLAAGIAAISITPERAEIVHFTQPYFYLGVRVMGGNAEFSVSLWQFLLPFSPALWGLTVAATLVIAGGFALTASYRRSDALWLAVSTILQSPSDMPDKGAGRLIGFSSMFTAMILISTYTASLSAYLSQRKASYKIDSIQDVTSGRVPGSRIGVVKGTTHARWMETNIPEQPAWSAGTQEEVFLAIKNGTVDATLIDSPMGEARAAVDCDLVLRGPRFEQESYGIMTRHGSIFQESFTKAVLQLNKEGHAQTLYERYFRSNRCTAQSSSARTLSLPDLAGSFLTFSIIVVLALSVHMSCRFWHTRYGKKEVKEEDETPDCVELRVAKEEKMNDSVTPPESTVTRSFSFRL
eukprot:TRINITY_DN3267_c1_g1_i1.p1 TRINITY_DN3267_c1_g1~~TRINITY_DN3267_c1_g1_i1.p1  ORF type:complete len:720 (+),score=100.62 TRINITY_DN3267_c1_g1_i1:59-2161(+)